MNQRKAKQLRKEALKQAVEQGLPYIEYKFKNFRKVAVKLDGTPVPYSVYTCFLGESQRKIYQQLKSELKKGVNK